MRYKIESTMAKWIVGSDGAAGVDLATVEQINLGPDLLGALAPLGVSVEIPQGHMGMLMPRSSLAMRGLIMVPGIIDSDYRGELKASVWLAPWATEARIEAGDRIAQLITVPIVDPTLWRESSTLRSTERGSCGFGSTGRQ